MTQKNSSLLLLVLLVISFQDLFSQAATITGWIHSDNIYCSSEDGHLLEGKSPSGKDFYFDGVKYDVSPVLTKIAAGKAMFYPSLAGVGEHTIIYGDIGSHDVRVIVTVVEAVTPTLAPFSNVCSTTTAFSLFNADSSNITPKNGLFSGPGVDASGNFNPAIAGPGVHTITYSVTTAGCTSSVTRPITVLAAPVTGINPFPPVCEDTPPFLLSQGFPAGGQYSGMGIDPSGKFDASVTGTGSFQVTYSYTNGICTNSATRNIIVAQKPSASFAGLGNVYCDNNAGINLTGSPTSVTGKFSGPGITDYGNGTALFEPVMAGLGIHRVDYIYTSPEGCVDTASQQVQIGTDVKLNGLSPQYCINHADIIITATPAGGFYSATKGLTDNGDGTAKFSPSTAAPGIHTVTYNYTDANGCLNIISQTVRVYALPVPSIINLAASYCADASPINIRGNYMPSGNFSGLAITDHANGTASFDPSKLAHGNSYPVTYTYSDAISGCSASVTNNVVIHPLPTGKLTGNADICDGNAANITIALTGSAPYSVTVSDGAGSFSLNNIAGPVHNQQVFPADTVTYRLTEVTDSHGCKSAGTGNALINVVPLVNIISHPNSQKLCPSADAAFSITAHGANLKYTWKKNGVVIPGATNPTLVISNVQPSDIGVYQCTVSGECGEPVVSNEASLQLWSPVSLTNGPSDLYKCESTDAFLQAQATGSNLSWQWFRNNKELTEGSGFLGTTSPNLTISPLVDSMAGSYHVIVKSVCGSVSSNPAVLNIDKAITIPGHPTDITVCEGNNAAFRTTASGDNLSFQWQFNGSDIPGETSDVMNISGSTITDNGFYRCLVQSACGSEVSSNSAKLTVLSKPAITFNPQNLKLCEGDNAVFSIKSEGSSVLFRWNRDGVPLTDNGRISGSAGSVLTIANIGAQDIGNYSCSVYNSCDSIVSLIASLEVDTSLAILTQPQSIRECLNNNVVFNITARGNNVSYQWYKDGNLLPGKNEPSLVINNISLSDAGSYFCKVSNSCGKSVSTLSAILMVDHPVSIIENPVDLNICIGENAIFTFKPAGEGLKYQWEFNGEPLKDAGNISGSVSPTLLITASEKINEGVYNCLVQGTCGKERSVPASLIVKDKLNITAQPENQVVCKGNLAQFTVEGSGILGYQWQKDEIDIPGAINKSLIIPDVDLSDSGVYRCLVYSLCDTLSSAGASLSVKTMPRVLLNPSPVTVCENVQITFEAKASGSDIKWQWMHDGLPISDDNRIHGSGSPALIIDSVSFTDAGLYSAIIDGYCASIGTDPVLLKVNPITAVLQQPVPVSVCEGKTTSFMVAATGGVAFQWQKDNVDLPGQIQETLVINNVDASDAGIYRCRITGYCEEIFSDGALLKVNTNSVITEQISDTTLCEGNLLTLRIGATGDSPEFRWKKDGLFISNDAHISGTDGPVLSIQNTLRDHSGIYQCEVRNACALTLSDPALVTIQEKINIVGQPLPAKRCQGQTAVFKIQATGDILTYQWQKDGSDIAGATSAQFDISSVSAADMGIYLCIINGPCGQIVSDAVGLEVDMPPVITVEPQPEVHVCSGNMLSAGFTVQGPGLAYQWYHNGMSLAGSTGNTLIIDPTAEIHEGVYFCQVSNACSTMYTNGIQVWIDEPAVITSQPENTELCAGEDLILGITATGDILGYQWYKNGLPVTDATAAPYIINNASLTDSGSYQCVITSACGQTSSHAVQVKVYEPLTVVSDPPEEISTCEQTELLLQVKVTGDPVSYQWKKNGLNLNNGGNLSGCQSPELRIANISEFDAGLYTCEITGNCNTKTSRVSKVNVKKKPSIVLQPVDFDVVLGGNASFTTSVSGDVEIWKWYYNNAEVSDDGAVAGASTGILRITGVAAVHEGIYTFEAQGSCGNIMSQPATLTILTNSLITSQPTGDIKCEGESITMSIETSGSGHTYQWKKNGSVISDDSRITGTKQVGLTITGIMASDAGSYSCLVDGIENSIPALLYVNRSTKIKYLTGDNTLCKGETAILFVEAQGDSLRYEWHKNGSVIDDEVAYSGFSTATLTVFPASQSHTGSYTCSVTGACGNMISDPLVLEVSDPVSIENHPRDTSVCEGQPVALSVTAKGTVQSWQWYKNGIALKEEPGISGTQSHTLLIAQPRVEDGGVYSCIVEGPCNRVYSGTASVRIDKMVEITSEPVNLDKCAGDLAVLTTVASISNATYQWQKDGKKLDDTAEISGSNTNTLIINRLQPSDSGYYHCIVTGNCNTVSGTPVRLRVNELTVIVSNPTGGSICEGSSFNFSVSATGSSLKYQWFKNGSQLSDDDIYSGCQTNTLVLDSARVQHAGTYYCRISGNCTTVESDYAVLTIHTNTSVLSTLPVSQICEGLDFSVSVLATGDTVSYRWEKDGIPLTEGGKFTGTTNQYLVIHNSTKAESGIYRCTVTGSCGTVVSAPQMVTVMERPSILEQPADTVLCEHENLLLNISTSGDSLTYNWRLNGSPVGINNSQLFITDILSSQSGTYTCDVSNICGIVKSNPATITINTPAVLLASPSDVSVCKGQQVSFRVEAAGSNLAYRWEHDGKTLSDDGRISGSTAKTMIINNTGNDDQGTYRCIISDSCGHIINSEGALLIIYEPVMIKSIPAGDTLCEGKSLNLFIDATGTDLIYRWYRNGIALTDGPQMIGTNTETLGILNSSKDLSGYYTCEITGKCGQKVTSPIPVIVTGSVAITQNPENLIRCEGENAVFSVTATGDSLKYQWFRNGVALTDDSGVNGSGSNILVLTDLTSSVSGSYYCVVSNSCHSVNSQAASLMVNKFPAAAGSISGETVVCQGTSNLVYSVDDIPATDYYYWTLPPGMVIVSGADTRQITVNFNLHESGGLVYVNGMNSCGAGLKSPALVVKANSLPVAYAGENNGICSDETILSALDGDITATGSWQVISGPAVIDLPSESTTTVRGLRHGENIFSWTVLSNGCSNSDTITIYNNRLDVEAGSDTSICSHIYRLGAEMPQQGTGRWSIVKGAGYNLDRFNPNSLVSGLAQGINVFSWSVNNNGCVSSDTVRITNNLPTESDAGNDKVLNSDYTNLSANIPKIGTGEWTLLNGSAVIADPRKHDTQVSNLGQGKNIFAWTITHKGCVSEDTVVINNSIMDSTDAGQNQVVCSNVVRLSAKNPHPGYGEWSVKKGSASFENNRAYNTYAYNLMQGENVLVWTQYLNGISSDSVVIINNLPTTANAGVGLSVCYDSVSLNANPPYVGNGEWSVVSGAGIFADRNSHTTKVDNLARGRNDFKWTITNKGCSSSSMVTIYNNKPTDASAGYDLIICEDSIVLMPNLPTFGIGEWSVLSGSAKFSGNVAYDLGTDNNKLIYTIRNKGCYSSDTVNITSHKPTQARLGSDQSICSDFTLIASNTPVIGTGVWSLQSGSADIDNIHAPSAVASNIAKGENIFRWTIEYMGCSSFDEMIISNDFVKADAGPDQTGCTDRTVLQANDPGYSSGVWTVIGGSTGASIIDPHSFNSTVQNLAPGSNVLRWTISKNGCESYDEVVIMNNRPTTAFAGENSYLCTDESKLRANPVTIGSGTWSILSGSGTISDEHDPAATVKGLAPGLNILRWTTENLECVSTDEVIITNNLPVNVNAGLDQVLCDDSTVLYANPPVIGTGTWSILHGSALFSEPGMHNTAVTRLGNGINKIIWTVSTTGCVDADTVEITNNLPTKAIAGSDFPVCNSMGNLSANMPFYGTGRWSIISGGGTIVQPDAPRTLVEDLALGNNTLQWTITNENCVSSDMLTIMNNSPTVADAGESSEVCGETAILYANSPQTGIGFWSVISGTGIPDDPYDYNTTVRGLNFGKNTLRWTTRNGDCQTSDEITITNNLAYVYAGEDQVVYDSRASLSGNNPDGGIGQWNLVAGQGNITSAGNFSTPVTELGAGINTFEWSITNGNCTARDQAAVHFKIMPVPGFLTSATEGCPGLTVNLTNTTRYGTTYRWDMGDGSFSNEVNPSHTFNYAGTFPVRLTAFGPDNWNIVSDTIITIFPKPVADFQFAPDTAITGNPVRFYNYSFGNGTSYSWNFNDNGYSTEENPVHYYANSGSFDITLIVQTGFGCSDTIVKTITVAEDGIIIFPNAFTPNLNGPNGGAYSLNDFSNDVFHPYFENIMEYHLEIYSRWGVLLFETDDLFTGWDGYYKGVLLGRDVYVWKATGKFVSGKQFLKTGNVLLISNE